MIPQSVVAQRSDSTPPGVESEHNTEVIPCGTNLYIVPIYSNLSMRMNGEVSVLASSQEEAIAKVEEQIDKGKVDNDLEMQDGTSGVVMSYQYVVNGGNNVEIDESQIEVDEEDSSRS